MVESRPRRSPAGPERKRDAERTRERILDAALVEFGEHGFAGARVGAIARRAGANQQLISYYFDGKEGLYRALVERWRTISAGVNQADAPLDEVLTAFAAVGEAQRHWVRLLVWQALEGNQEEGGSAYRRMMVDDLRRRQAAGEVAADLDPAFLLLALFGAALAPTLLRHFAEDFTGLAVDSPEFRARYADQLKRIVARLG
ncbi:helix-turn-helix domain containing protein [Asanoa sp. WMMD1127]|uniref:TetR/AcrR family transcriptional regulator n=1 Tax=Asanoa sp. WMMD1127 TaxID=3016107 RepID=UPI0024164F5F|nr:TetR/AcrR family transcriptional regulator [Asanoa sp. WMMD1127]MDG4827592.1 helix-turn-helix domain containing protein [Asanoa sp. WMMD1127]